MIDNIENKEKELFKVPDAYFEEFTESIMEKVNVEKSGKKANIFTLARPHLMLAASMIGLVIVSYSLLKLFIPGDNDSVSGSEIAFIEDYLAPDLDEVELYELLAQADTETGMEDLLSLEQSEEIIDFLIDLEIDESEIIDIY